LEKSLFARLRKFLDVVMPPNRLHDQGDNAIKDITGNFRSLSPTNC